MPALTALQGELERALKELQDLRRELGDRIVVSTSESEHFGIAAGAASRMKEICSRIEMLTILLIEANGGIN
ncbi:hypothetical protein [Bradyrhizobium guangdongense]|uniref:Uncharacterized protein n=1 Tax=Bradyrhizobium guangdongense TaxID=1325090 RepID=A0A410V3S2_9BRAD|nr:hypothetical protein [Bradyrhizobium guangdongense]QAU38315.1 hypothetical protein X265_11965 [Bradyrhizobium guangdongense]QOZ59370.1 hypothetical protein XH86_11965 [Bradyrhizobium guangdongense]GGI33165.1 hypothetical protein GCM10010987_73020 [Bradyrhizobium guangdongense]